ncbi:MAG: ATP-binding protein [Parashewanella sp.]
MASRLLIKLLLGFWLCSSLILGTVALLPLLQEQHDRAPLPTHLENLLIKVSDKFQSNPKLLSFIQSRKWQRIRDERGRPIKLYVVDETGRVINKPRPPRTLTRFIFMAEDAGHSIRHQFRNDFFFGPYRFNVKGKNYALYGQFPNRHPKPWFLFFSDNKLLTLSLAILLSGLVCGLLAWHLGKPLKLLKYSADKLAAGDLSSRVDAKTLRRADEIGQLANAFNDMATSVETMVKQQQRLIGDISHELRTPLTRLQLALALARKKGIDTIETQRIGYEAEQIEHLIAELLTLTRVGVNANEVKLQVTVNDMLAQVIADAEFEAKQQNKMLNVSIEDNIVLALHEKLFCRAVENILRNAVRYAEVNIDFNIALIDQQLQLVIMDDGAGLPESELKAIFQPFYRPDWARDRQTGGWGLGLAIAQAAVEAHKGKIWAEQISPHGLKVVLEVPI